MKNIPQDNLPDSTFLLAREGYRFISNRCERYNSDLFQTRLFLKNTICMRGHEAARLFYDTNRFSRNGVAPKFVQSTLFGYGGVQGLDDEEHLHRKKVFMSLMSRESIIQLCERMREQLHTGSCKWRNMDQVVLFYELQEIICRAVCIWCGVTLKQSEIFMRTKDLAAMIDGAGSFGFRFWRGVFARKRTEIWIEELIYKVRAQKEFMDENTPVYSIASHRELNGKLLDKDIAAVELINILRPIIAVSRFITFAALAIYTNPECKQKLILGNNKYLWCFVQEVRRYYPFFPFVAARTRKSFEWNDYHFPANQQVLLDLYGTNHDPVIWENPEEFRPERFLQWDENSFNFIPQGDGDYYPNHRCAGEWIAIELMKKGTEFLVHNLQYDVPYQNLTVEMSRMPALPKSRFIINNVNICNIL